MDAHNKGTPLFSARESHKGHVIQHVIFRRLKYLRRARGNALIRTCMRPPTFSSTHCGKQKVGRRINSASVASGDRKGATERAMGLPPLEYIECYLDSPNFREIIVEYERELEENAGHVKSLVKECRHMIQATEGMRAGSGGRGRKVEHAGSNVLDAH